MEADVRFTWKVHKAGYVSAAGLLLTDEGDLVSPAVETTIISEGVRYRHESQTAYSYYEPFERFSGLFLEFAHLKDNAASFITFANQYGLLGVERFEVETVSKPGKAALAMEGERADTWGQEVSTIREAVGSWEGYRMKTPKDRKTPGKKPPSISRQRQRSLEPVMDSIDAHLRGHVVAGYDHEPRRALPTVFLEPDSLLTAIWLQFGIAVQENKHFKQCVQCGSWFAVHPGQARSDRQYCSDSCRYKAYRARKARLEHLDR